jgi:small redox-active disulfide protein 2
MEIKVLGSGCANCKRLYQFTLQAVSDLAIDAEVLYVTDMHAIADSGLMRTPGLIIDGKIVSYGRVSTVDEIKNLINKANI